MTADAGNAPSPAGSREEWPLVSVITPTYNAAAFLDETIRSVLEQGYPNLEYIVLDDGSTDDTPAILERYGDKLRAERHANMGETLTVNKGFSIASGEIIGVVNADDPLLPGAIEKIVGRLVGDPAIVVSYPDWAMIDEQGNRIRQVTTFEYSYRDMVRWHHCIPGPGAFFRASLLERIGGRDPRFRYTADLEFWFRAGLVGPFARVPEVLACHRVHSSSISVSQQGDEMAREHIAVVDGLYSHPGIPPEIAAVRREAYSSAYYVAGWLAGKGLRAAPVKARYWSRALLYAPEKYLREYRPRLSLIASAGLARVAGVLTGPVAARLGRGRAPA